MSEAVPGPIKVLVIDDSNTIRRSAEIFLRQAGFEVILAEDEHVVEALGAHAAQEALADGVRVRRSDGRAQDLDSGPRSHVVEPPAELVYPFVELRG